MSTFWYVSHPCLRKSACTPVLYARISALLVSDLPDVEKIVYHLKDDLSELQKIFVNAEEFEKLEDKTGKIQREFEVVREIGTELKFTQEIVFSSTELLNKHFLNTA